MLASGMLAAAAAAPVFASRQYIMPCLHESPHSRTMRHACCTGASVDLQVAHCILSAAPRPGRYWKQMKLLVHMGPLGRPALPS